METVPELKPEDLCARCDHEELPFASTNELTPLNRTVGQGRAVRSLEVGLGITASGFNLFVAGRPGTGRTSIVHELVEQEARGKPVPDDWIYVHNFSAPDRPRAISLPAGKGSAFAREMELLVSSAQLELQKLFESPLYRERKDVLEREAAQAKQDEVLKTQRESLALGFSIEFAPNGILTIPMKDGKKLTPQEFESLDDREKGDFRTNGQKVHELLEQMLQISRQIDRNLREKVASLEKEMASSLLTPLFQKLESEYRDLASILSWLKEAKEDLVEHLDDLKDKDEQPGIPFLEKPQPNVSRFKINAFVDRSGLEGAPVVKESNPSFYNLMGKIEYRPAFGTWVTDQTMIKAGALETANGGFLIIPAQDLFSAPFAWDALKRSLRSGSARVENLSEFAGGVPTATLRPEPIPVSLKVIMIGQPEHFHMLYALDEDFRKLFKIRADFDLEMPRNDQTIADYASFLHLLEHEDPCLLPFHSSAVARLVEFGSRLVEAKNKLSARFMEIADMAYEACYWAKKAGAEKVEAEHVLQALEEKVFRSRLIEDKIQELIEKDTILINVREKSVGQVNSLSIYASGAYSFGRPSRITARVFLGKTGVVNIEREIALSGPIHSKGVLILGGYLGGMYAREFPLTLSASLTFEQLYEGVEGDSASSAELYALLSALAEVPLSQEIAVTGSVNQFGEIQPIGGVNEKIEGFYAVCRAKGLSGSQGVIIPVANVKNLMLKEEVVEAVREGKFHVWAVKSVDEGLELLTGIPAGERGEGGEFTPHSVHALVSARLRQFAERLRDFYPG